MDPRIIDVRPTRPRGLWFCAVVAAFAVSRVAAAQQVAPPDHAAHRAVTAPATIADPVLAEQMAELRAKVSALEAALGHGATSGGTGGSPATGSGTAGTGMNMGSGQAGAGGMTPGAKAMGGGMEAMPGMGSPGGGGMSSMGGMPGGGGQGGMTKEMGMMPGMAGGGGMPNMPGMAGGMPGMSGGGMPGMSGGMKDMMGMMNMMGMAPSASMAGAAALPGFPGASHIYHVGGTDLFLDHGQHVGLTLPQRTTLGQLKERTTLDQASIDRKVEQAEQELWSLTAADQPDAAAVEAKVAEIEKLRGDKRLAFIRAVGEAAKVLTPEQRQILMGLTAPVPPTTPAGTAPAGGGR